MWDKEYLENKNDYHNIFDNMMIKDYEGNVENLERDLSTFSGRKYCIAVNSATDALKFSLLSNGIGPGDEVLVTNFSWISTSSCISMVGAIPVFCDIDIETYHISFDKIKKMKTKKTKALIYTHLFGNMIDTSEIEKWCDENNIILIEDSAQSLGSSFDGRKAGTIGQCSSYSFNSNKVIAGISGGGVFMTNDKNQAEYVKKIRRHGKDEEFEFLGYNSKMYVPNADIIRYRLQHWEKWQRTRQQIANIYDFELKDSPIILPPKDPKADHNYHKYVIRFESEEDRSWVQEGLKHAGIKYQVHYGKALKDNKLYYNIKHKSCKGKNAQLVAKTVMSLPIHPWISEEEVDKICSTFQTLM